MVQKGKGEDVSERLHKLLELRGSAEPVPTAHPDIHSCTASHEPPCSKCSSSWRKMWNSTSPREEVGSGWGKKVSTRAPFLPRPQLLTPVPCPLFQCSLTGLAPRRIEIASALPAPSSGPRVSAFPPTPPLSKVPSTQKQLALAGREVAGWHCNHTQKSSFLIVGDGQHS